MSHDTGNQEYTISCWRVLDRFHCKDAYDSCYIKPHPIHFDPHFPIKDEDVSSFWYIYLLIISPPVTKLTPVYQYIVPSSSIQLYPCIRFVYCSKLLEHYPGFTPPSNNINTQNDDLEMVTPASHIHRGCGPFPRIPVANKGLGRDSLLKMVHNPGGHWNPGKGPLTQYMPHFLGFLLFHFRGFYLFFAKISRFPFEAPNPNHLYRFHTDIPDVGHDLVSTRDLRRGARPELVV